MDVTEPTPLKVSTHANDACNHGAVKFVSTGSGGTKPYKYSYSGDAGLNLPLQSGEEAFYAFPDTGVYAYSVTVVDSNTCTNTQASSAKVLLSPSAAFSTQKMSDNEFNFSDSSLNATSIQWAFDDGDISFEKNPTHIYGKSGYYDVLLIASNKGCQDSAMEKVMALNEIGFYIPNSFSPNGDGSNDSFICYGTGIHAFKMSIYNRWGELIFSSNDISLPWDGKLKDGRPAMTGMYDYLIEVFDTNGSTFDRRGGIFLMR